MPITCPTIKFELPDDWIEEVIHTVFKVPYGYSYPQQEFVTKALSASDTFEEFAEMIFHFNKLKCTHLYAEVSKASRGHWYRVREMFGEDCHKSVNNRMGLLLESADKTNEVSIELKCENENIRHGVIPVGRFNKYMMENTGVIVRGSYNAIENDYYRRSDTLYTINGAHRVYRYDGIIAFVKCN